jgi:hypothetical protein
MRVTDPMNLGTTESVAARAPEVETIHPAMETVRARRYHDRGDHGGDSLTQGNSMATQEQDFNKETNRQFTRLFIKDSQGITIDLTEVQCAQVLQSLLMLSDPQRRLKPSPGREGTVSKHFERLLSPADGEMQDSELNSLLQGQSIYIENCTDVRISIRQLEVEKVVELGLVALGLREHQVTAKAPAVDAAGASIEHTEP